MSPLRHLIPALVAALLLAACGSGGPGPAGGGSAHGGGHAAAENVPPPVEGAPEITVNAVDIDFEPPTLELTAGEPTNVTVVNDGETLHDFTVEAADVHVNVEPGQSTTTAVTIDEPGTYEAKCTVEGHAEAGMTIKIVVS